MHHPSPIHRNHRTIRDPTRVLLTPFASLTTLELHHCDLSTTAWRGLHRVQGALKTIIATNSLEALHHLLAPARREWHGDETLTRHPSTSTVGSRAAGSASSTEGAYDCV